MSAPLPLRNFASTTARVVSLPARDSERAARCTQCGVHAFCASNAQGLPAGADVAAARVRLRKGDALVRAGTPFNALYAVRSGTCKSVLVTPDGQEQIVDCHIAGDIVGTDGIATGVHDCAVTALEDTELCVLPFDHLEALARSNRDFQRNLHSLLSREIRRERKTMLMLGTMRAEQRLAAFLLDLAERYAARGYSASEVVLRMTREDIGRHLGMKLETVSRLFSRFDQEGLIRVHGREVKLIDRGALRQLVQTTLQ